MNFNECLSLLELMNIQTSNDHAKELFKVMLRNNQALCCGFIVSRSELKLTKNQTANVNNKTKEQERVLDYQQFVTFVGLVVKRKELEDLFHRYFYFRSVWFLIIMSKYCLILKFNSLYISRLDTRTAPDRLCLRQNWSILWKESSTQR